VSGPYKISDLRRRAAAWLAPVLAPKPNPRTEDLDHAWLALVRRLTNRDGLSILELGTRCQEGQPLLRRDAVFPKAVRYVGVDQEAGEGVDIVADAHSLSKAVEPESFDATLALSTFEHIKYPWLAAHEMAKVTKQGGLIYVSSHQSFALHGAPHDYWRFSANGFRALFPESMGVTVLQCLYTRPCLIVAGEDPQQALGRSYLCVSLLAQKVGPTPDSFPYEL
jgi:SAM-dependent methyltransferase